MTTPHDMVHTTQGPYNHGIEVYNTPTYTERDTGNNQFSYGAIPQIPITLADNQFQPSLAFQPVNPTLPPPSGGNTWSNDTYPVGDLSDVLGALKIDENGIAPYISQQKKSLAEAPALEEFEAKLPTITTGSGSTVRIPPDLMPTDEQCMAWFDVFFSQIHPYVPVLSKSYFYQQWRTNRRSISPLILEAMFACAGRLSDDPAQGAQWLALASRHEDCFMDVPRLSTIQALLLLLKARESAPKRGYYYRSWMTVKTLVTMAKDLELHEHYSDHQAGRDCGSDPTECLVKTRIWQNIFICEMMIGGPQGRFDMGVDIDTINFNPLRPMPGIDASDYQVSRQFLYLVRNVRNVRHLHDTYGKVRKQKDWASDPKFSSLNPEAISWVDDLPRDLQIDFPDGDGPPYLPNHFVGNMHCYYHLNVIMVHRPQLMSSSSFATGGGWRKHMKVCYDSSRKMCRLQEAIYQTFGLSGLLCMQRGINFVIYSVLTCTMIHLVAITSPDPEFNSDAKDYFTRHMRILESCTSAWPMPEMQASIDALREAFSADTSQPFRLRANFLYGSPVASLRGSDPVDTKYQPPLSRETSHEQVHYSQQPLTPPISAGLEDSKDRPMGASTMDLMASGGLSMDSMGNDRSGWDPTRIFEYGISYAPSHGVANNRYSQWNTAFGTPASTMNNSSQPSPPAYTPPSVGSHDMSHINDSMQHQQQQFPMQSTMAPLPQVQATPQMPNYANPTPSFVTSSMWRETVANSFDPTNKRRWDIESSFLADTVSPKRAR
ncbi:MAG: hypothetical protein Q9214_005182 [Letrouitia sp. 1 TL-2023]